MHHADSLAATASYFEGSTRLPDPAAGWVEILRQNRQATSQIIYGVPYWTYYRVRLRAMNAFGAGAWVEIGYRLVEDVRGPNFAQNVRVASGDGKLTLTWRAPSAWGDWPPGGYEVEWKLASAVSTEWAAVWTSGAAAVIGPDATRFEFTGQQQGSASVTNGLAYDLRIRAWSKRPGTDGSVANAGRATTIWYPAKVSGTPAAASKSPTPTVSLSAAPNPVAEGSDVSVTATLSSPLPYEATIPLSLSLTHVHGTAEDGDYGALASITIPAGLSSATGTITTSQDADADDETFTVALDMANLPSYVATGDPSSTGVTVTITDDETQPQQQQQQQQQQRAASPLTAAFEGAPQAHDGKAAFSLDLRFSEALGTDGRTPAVSSFKVAGGKAKRVERVEPGLWRVRVKPRGWREVTVTLAPSSVTARRPARCAHRAAGGSRTRRRRRWAARCACGSRAARRARAGTSAWTSR